VVEGCSLVHALNVQLSKLKVRPVLPPLPPLLLLLLLLLLFVRVLSGMCFFGPLLIQSLSLSSC